MTPFFCQDLCRLFDVVLKVVVGLGLCSRKLHMASNAAALEHVFHRPARLGHVSLVEQTFLVILVLPIGEKQVPLDQVGKPVVTLGVRGVERKHTVVDFQGQAAHDKLLARADHESAQNALDAGQPSCLAQ